MSFILQNALKNLDLYSPPPSHLIVLILFLVWFSTKALKTLSLSSTLNLVFMVWKNVLLNKQSMKVLKYFTLPWNVVAMGLNRFMCTSPNFFLAWEPHLKEMGYDGWHAPKLLKRPKSGSQNEITKKKIWACPLVRNTSKVGKRAGTLGWNSSKFTSTCTNKERR